MLSFKSFKAFLNEDYKTTAVKFVASGIDKVQVDDYIKKFRELSNKQKLAGEEKNIDFWSKKTFSEFKEFVDVKEKEVADVAKKKAEKKDPGTSFDITTPEQRSAGWKIIIPLDKKASVFYGNLDCMSDWCVAKTEHDYFNQYFYEKNSNLIFCLDDNKKKKWAIEIESDGSTIIFYDIKDNQRSKSEFEKLTKLKFTDIFRSYEPFIEKIKAFKFENISLVRLQKLKSKFPNATLEMWHTHPNGGGWVENTAKVSGSAYVGRDAIVYGNAQVYGYAVVYGYAQVYGKAKVYGKYAQVSGNAKVYGDAMVYGNATVYGYAKVYDNAWVSGNAKVYGYAKVYGNAKVYGYAKVYGDALVYGNAKVSEKAKVSGNTKVSGNEIVEIKNMLSFKAFLDEDYKTAAEKFIASGIDKVQVDDYILKFKELSNKQKLAGDEKNIDTWAKKTFSEFKEFVDVKEKEVADVAKKKAEKKDPGESIDITSPQQRSAGWKIIIPLDKAASVFYGNLDCMSDWCVSKREHDYFNEYFYNQNSNLIFCLNDKKEKWAIEFKAPSPKFGNEIIFYDIKDDQISKSEFEKQTKLNFDDILRSYKPKIEEIKDFKRPYFDKISLAKFQKLKSKFPNATPETWHSHPNGGGWVQNTAKVSDSVNVEPDAIVYGNAIVSGNAEVYGNAQVFGDAVVSGNAVVAGNAQVFGDARVSENAEVSGNNKVSGNAQVYGDAGVYGDAQVFGDARVSGNAWVSGYAVVSGNAWVSGNARVSGNAMVYGKAKISGKAEVYGNALVYGDAAQVYGNTQVFGNAKVSGNTKVSGNARVFGNAKISGNTKVSGNEMLD